MCAPSAGAPRPTASMAAAISSSNRATMANRGSRRDGFIDRL
jgi:hypothetical protein